MREKNAETGFSQPSLQRPNSPIVIAPPMEIEDERCVCRTIARESDGSPINDCRLNLGQQIILHLTGIQEPGSCSANALGDGQARYECAEPANGLEERAPIDGGHACFS